MERLLQLRFAYRRSVRSRQRCQPPAEPGPPDGPQERAELSLPKVWQMVLDAQHHAPAHEPRVRRGEEDPVQVLLQKVSPQMEPRTAHQAPAHERKAQTSPAPATAAPSAAAAATTAAAATAAATTATAGKSTSVQ